MTFALNEVEAMAKRAARGAGYSWGLAEEAAKATRWLCAQGQDGVGVLAVLLEARPAPESCPIAQGAHLSDCAARIPVDGFSVVNLVQPLVLLPFVAMAARRLQTVLTVECSGARAITDGAALWMEEALPDIAPRIRVMAAGTAQSDGPKATRARPDPAAWAILDSFAHRTYAPATEESRRLGAGAGLSDND
ncbi:DUF3726 domain-containing protein [Shimia sp. SDUM112013]|uniref:DUF3726 domain-containing protein n=1 Tax=Shimia sp. SDUM112013 TaxID=3136160 RepID=UPI0032EAF022